jgi:hypothetical protein
LPTACRAAVDSPSYDYAHFSMSSGPAAISVRKLNNTNIGAYTISPRKLGLLGTVNGSTLTFTIPNDEYFDREARRSRRPRDRRRSGRDRPSRFLRPAHPQRHPVRR